VVFLVFVSFTDEAAAQGHFEIGAQAAVARSSEFDRADTGVGGRLSWFPNGMLGAEAEMDVYPRSFPGRTPFSRSRLEGLFGVTVGPRLARARPFVRLR